MGKIREWWEKEFSMVSEGNIRAFAKSIRDFNPVHHDDEAAKKAKLRGIIATGVMVSGFPSAAVAEEIPGAIIMNMKMRFVRPLYAGSVPTVFCDVERQNERRASICFQVRNGSELIADGSYLVSLPRK